MSKLKNSRGLTLIEMLAALLILVILVMGMGFAMQAGTAIYREAVFASDSAALADILNTALGDILRYSRDIRINGVYDGDGDGAADVWYTSSGSVLDPEQTGFVFSNWEYGVLDAYFHTAGDTSGGVLQLGNLHDESMVALVNTGVYPDLAVANFRAVYIPAGADGLRGGYFEVSYDIRSERQESLIRHVETVIRLMNDEK